MGVCIIAISIIVLIFILKAKKAKKKNNLIPINENKIIETRNTDLVSSKTLNADFKIHEELKGLLWFADGIYQNYKNEKEDENTFYVGDIKISFVSPGSEEPSLIYTKAPININEKCFDIERPPYYPTYKSLTPEQRGNYIKFLENPFIGNVDIGYVFLLYYGLERHLLYGDYERAYKLILKLRDIYSNGSFQSYSANALVLTSLLHKKGEIAQDFIMSLDKEFEFNFSDNLFLICYYSFNLPLKPKDIMRMSKTFEFQNMNYIKKYPDIFLDILTENFKNKFNKEYILISDILSKTDILKLEKQDIRIFANTSLSEQSVPVPMLANCFKLKNLFFNLLQDTHELTKKMIADLRKKGTLIVSDAKNKQSPKKELKFDTKKEAELLAQLSEVKKDLVRRHFVFLMLEDFYYKYRDLDNEYIEKCKEYCIKDISSLNEMEEEFILQEIESAKYTGESVEKIRKTGFIGRIPSFSRLIIIYEKENDYDNAIKICDKAISFKHEADVYKEKKEKLLEKMKKINNT